MMTNKVLYQDLLPYEFIRRVNACPIAYLPLGTLEWHSFHLPYGTDMSIPLEIFKRIAARAGGVVLPPLYLGPDGVSEQGGEEYYGMELNSFDEEHLQRLVGDMHYVPEPFFVQLLEYIITNIKRCGFAALVAYGHGPSVFSLIKNRERLENQFGIKVYVLLDFCHDESGGMPGIHADLYETGMFMALYPGSADLALLPKDTPPVSVWGYDPRSDKTEKDGERLVALYEEQAVSKLIRINNELPKPNLTLEYHHVKDIRY